MATLSLHRLQRHRSLPRSNVRMMVKWDTVYQNTGLPQTRVQRSASHRSLRERGPSPLHRQSFAPVWNAPIPQDAFEFMLDEIEPQPDVELVETGT